jgi:hypothetical protein
MQYEIQKLHLCDEVNDGKFPKYFCIYICKYDVFLLMPICHILYIHSPVMSILWHGVNDKKFQKYFSSKYM